MENVRKFPELVRKNPPADGVYERNKIHRKYLINKLNAINFKKGSILVKLKHVKYNRTMIRQARPLACAGDELECVWDSADGQLQDYGSYQFLNITLHDGPNLLLLESELASLSEDGLRVFLPETCRQIGSRSVRRLSCKHIKARIVQNSAIFNGVLVEFSPSSFDVRVKTSPTQTFKWIDQDISVSVTFFDGNLICYTGTCRIVRQDEAHDTTRFILEPLGNQIRRFKPKEYRSTRQQLLPLPNVTFCHPFSKKLVSLRVIDISGTGFAVKENSINAVLLPGLCLSEMELNFAGSFKITCKVQVVYRKKIDDAAEKAHFMKCGLTIIDMDIEEHRRLLALLHQANESHSYLNRPINMEVLWDFFFESGFIYPQKYSFFQANKDTIKETYKKLYDSESTIARNFIYEKNDRIMGHMAMVRFYNNSWLIHHHAASLSGSNRAGLGVLNQVGRFINDSHRLYSAHMNFVFCYFRPENKFPEKVFGGVRRGINDAKGCSIDNFAYFHYRKSENDNFKDVKGWSLTISDPSDLTELKNYYEYCSGGLMLAALELEAGLTNMDSLKEEYQRLGFKRERHLFSLKKNKNLKAVIMVNISDIGLNFSSLTNCIQVFVVDPDNLPREMFYRSVAQLSSKIEGEDVPVLLFPSSFAKSWSVAYEKSYALWVLNMKYTDHYFKHLKKLIGHIQH